MSDAPAPRTGRFGVVFTAVVVGGSAIGVIGWYLVTNRKGPVIDASGFDLSATTKPQAPLPVLSAADSGAAPRSSLSMLRADAGISVGQSAPPPPAAASDSAAAAPAAGTPKEQARADFTTEARKDETTIRRYAERMSAKSPVIRQYGRDWMSHPDLKKLNDDYMRDHDPIAFIMGLSRAPSLGPMLKAYAGKPEIREFIVQGMKEAPAELTSSAMEVLQKDGVVKALVANVASGLGLPPSVTAMIGGGDASQIDQSKAMSGVMNDPEVQKAMQNQPSAVPLGR